MSALRRVAVTVPVIEAEAARARLLAEFPEGFEEAEDDEGVELAVYVDTEGERRFARIFAVARSLPVRADWSERWQRFHRPAVVGPLWVGPPWEAPPAGLLPVVIDPGAAFGTGAHETTRLCLSFLADLPRGSLLDVGCGSGVLAIAAARLGFGPVVAVDHDEAAVAAARANGRANGVAIEVRGADALTDPLPSSVTAVANLDAALAGLVLSRLAAERVVLSGYLEAFAPEIAGFRAAERRTDGGWAADLYVRA